MTSLPPIPWFPWFNASILESTDTSDSPDAPGTNNAGNANTIFHHQYDESYRPSPLEKQPGHFASSNPLSPYEVDEVRVDSFQQEHSRKHSRQLSLQPSAQAVQHTNQNSSIFLHTTPQRSHEDRNDALRDNHVDNRHHMGPHFSPHVRTLSALYGDSSASKNTFLPDWGRIYPFLPPSLPLPSRPLPPLPPSVQEVWMTIQNSSMFLNTMPPQSDENRDHDVLDNNASDVKQQHYKGGFMVHSAAGTTTSYPSPCTRTYFTLCSLAEYISQFDLTDPDAAEKVKTDEEYIMYQDAYSYFPAATITTTMTLYFLFHTPQIYLPLAPFRNAIYSAVELAYTFHLAHWQYETSFNVICQLVTGILTMRIRHAVSHLYPHLQLLRGQPVPQLEYDRPPILEWLARDMLAAFNPIEIMLMYYRPIIAEFNQIPSPTPQDRRLCFKKVQWIDGWLREMHFICMTYGLHIHHSRWVSMNEWKELAGFMNTISTKIAPDVFDVVQGRHPDPASDKERLELSSTKIWYETFLCFLAPCFTHHYRPIGIPSRYKVPYGNYPTSGTSFCYLPPTAYSDMMVNLPIALEQYATMYVEDPQQFECKESQAVSLSPQTHYGTNGDITPSSIRSAFNDIMNKTSPTLEEDPYTYTKEYQHLELKLPSYPNFTRIQYLIRAIVECPPMDNPVYTLFAPWFINAPDNIRFIVPNPHTPPEDPEFVYNYRPYHE